MIYIKKKQVKQKAHQLGFRTSPTFLSMLDATVELILIQMVNWTTPMKTMTERTMAEYLVHHKIRRR